MGILDQAKRYRVFSKTVASKAVFGLVILLAVIIILTVSLVGMYVDEMNRTGIPDIPEAKNVGNWEYVDKDYVLKKYETFIVNGRSIRAVTLRDNKNGNKLVIFEAEFTLSEISRTKEEILNNLLVIYSLDNSYFKQSGMTGKIGQEFIYNSVGWNSIVGEKAGMIGNLDCLLENGNKSSIFLIVENSLGNYSSSRALEFANTLNCLDIQNNNTSDDVVDKLDTDDDGLTDKVEKMLKNIDPNNADSDGDGTSDGDEIKVGRNPAMHKQWQDVFSAEDFDKVKRDIKFISIYNYDKLFPEN